MFLTTVALMFGCCLAGPTNSSPNKFPVGQCTWGVDVVSAQGGVTLQFTASSGRDAKKWNTMLKGARANGPQAKTVMILDGWGSGATKNGHVAWVESVQSNGRFTVVQANWNGGARVKLIDGQEIRRLQFELVGNSKNRVRVVGGSKEYPLLGFIRP